MMMRYFKHLLFFLLSGYSLASFAISSSIVDPALSFTNQSSQAITGYLKTKISRNIRLSDNNFTDLDQQDGLLDNLYVNQNLNLSYTLNSSSSLLKGADVFFELNYRRPVYGSIEETRKICWNAVLCFGNINLGLSKRALQSGNFKAEASVYLRIPFSKSAFDQSFLSGLGTTLSTNYNLLSNSHLYLSIVSNHSINWNLYFYDTANAEKTNYNVPLSISNLAGVQFKFLTNNPFFPRLFFYSNHSFSLNSYNTSFHYLSLHTSASWSVNKRIRIVAGLNWQDRIFKPQNLALTVDTVVFNPDRTFLSLAGSYSF